LEKENRISRNCEVATKNINIYVMKIPEREERKNKQQTKAFEVMTKHFPKLMKYLVVG
jgi:hypothetical protein